MRRSEFNRELVLDSLDQQNLRTLTLDMEGSVLCTGLQVERAFRGFNPHHRKNPSYLALAGSPRTHPPERASRERSSCALVSLHISARCRERGELRTGFIA